MKWGATVFLIFFAAFILLLIFNPNLSCFGKRVKSPFYPLLRRRRGSGGQKKIQTTDYGFHPGGDAPAAPGSPEPHESKTTAPAEKTEAQKKARDYGFKLD